MGKADELDGFGAAGVMEEAGRRSVAAIARHVQMLVGFHTTVRDNSPYPS